MELLIACVFVFGCLILRQLQRIERALSSPPTSAEEEGLFDLTEEGGPGGREKPYRWN